MGLKIRLMRDEEVLLEIPLDYQTSETSLNKIFSELEKEVEHIIKVNKILSNETRARILLNIVKNSDCRFTELMEDLKANQKIINESLHSMIREGLLSREIITSREVHYHPSPRGVATLMMCAAIRRIMDELE